MAVLAYCDIKKKVMKAGAACGIIGRKKGDVRYGNYQGRMDNARAEMGRPEEDTHLW